MTSSGTNSKNSGSGSTWTHKVDSKVSKTIKLKKPAPPKPNNPGSWKDTSVSGRDSAKSPPAESPLSPLVTPVDETLSSSHPATDPSETRNCKICKKPVLEAQLAAHVKSCLKLKNERAKERKLKKEAKEKAAKEAENKDKDKDDSTAKINGDADDNPLTNGTDTPEKKGAKKSAKNAEDGEKKSKKRKADGEAKLPKAKKKKEEAKAKTAKPKGPVDVEKQCGVILPNGQMCARSLTCKSHSMGAKRDVPGRSLPYDMLLQAYQRKNQAKQQKAAIDANNNFQDETDRNAGPIDSDEERDVVMAAISRSKPTPLAEPILVTARSKYSYLRAKNMFASAFGNARSNALGFFASSVPTNAFGFTMDSNNNSAGIGGGGLMSAMSDSVTTPGPFDPPSRRQSMVQPPLNSASSRTSFSGPAVPNRKPSGPVPPSPIVAQCVLG